MYIKRFLIFIAFISITILAHAISDEDNKYYNTEIKSDLYQNASVAILLDKTNIIINSDNTWKMQKRIIKKIINYKGKKENSEYKIYFDKRFEDVVINSAKTIKASSLQEFELKAENIQEMDGDTGKMDYAVHKTKILLFPSVDDGDILDVSYTVTNKSKLKISLDFIFASNESLYNKFIMITAPNSVKFNTVKYSWDKNISYSELSEKGYHTIMCSAKNLPQIISEDSMPELRTFIPTLFFSTYNNWDEYKDIILKKYSASIKVTPEVRALTLKVTKDSKNLEEKVKEIIKYIAKNTNYIDVRNIISFEFRKPDQIIESGYVSSFDRITLLNSMLKAINVEATPVIVGVDKVYYDNTLKYPIPSKFEYSIAFIKVNGRVYYVNPVSEFSPLGFIENTNDYGFMVKPGNTEFTLILSDSNNRDYNKTKTEIAISSTGSAIITSSSIYKGASAVSLRARYTYMTPIDKEHNFEEILSSVSQNVEPISTGLDLDLTNPVKLGYQYLYNNFATIDKDFFYFDIPVSLSPISMKIEPSERNYPYVIFSNYIMEYETSIISPENMEIIMFPGEFNIKTKLFEITRRIVKTDDGKRVTLKDRITYIPGIVTVKEYGEIYEVLKTLGYPKYYKVLMKRR